MSSSDFNSNTVTQHPLQDVDINAPITSSSSSPLGSKDHISQMDTTKNAKKENWVKFDDDANEGILGTSPSNTNNNIDVTDNASIHTGVQSMSATAANRLTPTPLPPPNTAKRNSAAAVAAAGSSARPRTPTMESGAQPLHTVELDASLTSVPSPPVQQRPSPNTSIPDVAAPAVLTTESTHVDLNASGRKLSHQHQQQQHHPNSNNQQQHHQKTSTTAGHNNKNNVANANASQHNLQQHLQQQLPHHSNHVATTAKLPSSGTAGTASGSAVTTATSIPIESQPPMRTIELSTGRIREGFANGDVIVTLLPANTRFPWVTPAIFRPELVPEELMAQGLTLTVEEYVHAMETLVNDYRFTLYNICYKRILVCWILFAFSVLLTLLFSGLQGVALFSLGVAWLFLNAAFIFLCMWIKLRLSRGLEKCLARVNKQLIKHKILLILDDRGRISCHKVNLCFLYFDSAPCVSFLNEFLENTEQNGGEAVKAGWEAKLDIDMNDIIIQGSNPVRVSRKQAVAQELYLTYLQRWGKDFLRRRLDWTVQEAGVHETPRHLQSSICPCQYEEELLRNKIKMYLQRKQCCGINCLGCWM